MTQISCEQPESYRFTSCSWNWDPKDTETNENALFTNEGRSAKHFAGSFCFGNGIWTPIKIIVHNQALIIGIQGLFRLWK